MSALKIKNKIFNSEIKVLEDKNLEEFQNQFSYQKFYKGQKIFYEGHMPYGLFFLTSGEITIKYKNSRTETVNSPAIIGFSAFINNKPYCGTAEAVTDSELYFISTNSYKNLIEKNILVSTWFEEK